MGHNQTGQAHAGHAQAGQFQIHCKILDNEYVKIRHGKDFEPNVNYDLFIFLFFQQWNQQQQQQQGGAGGILQARLNPGQKQGGDNPTLKGLLNQGPQGPSQPQLGVNISLLIFVFMRPKSWGNSLKTKRLQKIGQQKYSLEISRSLPKSSFK
jgi:hypothetical protein